MNEQSKRNSRKMTKGHAFKNVSQGKRKNVVHRSLFLQTVVSRKKKDIVREKLHVNSKKTDSTNRCGQAHNHLPIVIIFSPGGKRLCKDIETD